MFVTKKKYRELEKKHQRNLIAYQSEVERHSNARIELDKLKTGIIPDPERPEIEEVFTDPEGRKYYRFVNPIEMPAVRGFKLQEYGRESELGVTKDLLATYLEESKKWFNRGEITKGFALFEKLQDRLNVPGDSDILLKIASVHYLREDEDWRVFSEKIAQEKIEYWKSEPKVLAFFLSMSFKEIYNYGDKSEQSIQKFLREAQEQLKELAPTKQDSEKYAGIMSSLTS